MTALLARWTEKLAGGPQAGTSDSPPPLAMVMGVGRQQQLGSALPGSLVGESVFRTAKLEILTESASWLSVESVVLEFQSE